MVTVVLVALPQKILTKFLVYSSWGLTKSCKADITHWLLRIFCQIKISSHDPLVNLTLHRQKDKKKIQDLSI
jgi:hypothetical protein